MALRNVLYRGYNGHDRQKFSESFDEVFRSVQLTDSSNMLENVLVRRAVA